MTAGRVSSSKEQPFSVLFVISSLGRGGAERQMIVLASGLRDRGHRVAIALLDAEGALAAEAEMAGLELIRLYHRRGSLSAPKVLRFIRAVRRFAPDAVHSYLPRDNARVALVRRILRPSKIVWGLRASEVDWNAYGRVRTSVWPVVTRLSRRADLIIANSWAGAHYHIALGYPAERMVVIPNGIDTERFRRDQDAAARFRRENAIPADAKVVGMLARFDPMKGQNLFPAIVHQILESVPGVFGVIVGAHSDAQRAEVFRLASHLGVAERIAVIDPTPTPWVALSAFDALVVPSTFGEGFPNVIGEALACDVPVASFDVGDAQRILDGIVEVAPQGDVPALARIAAELLDGDTAQATRTAVIANYSIEALVTASETTLARALLPRRAAQLSQVDGSPPESPAALGSALKVLLFITSLGGGGAERQLVLLARELTALGHEVTIAVLDPGGQHYESAIGLGLNVVVLTRRGGLGLISLASLLRRGRFDFAYSFLPESNAKLAAVSWVSPSTRVVWGVRASNIDLSQYGLRARMAWKAARVLSYLPDVIISNSRAGADFHIANGYPTDSVVIVNNAVDAEVFYPDTEAGRRFRDELGIPRDATVVGMLARYDPMKGHAYFLDVVSILCDRIPGLVAIVAGVDRPEDVNLLHEAARRLRIEDQVNIVGHTDTPQACLNALDALVVPSTSEGFPNVIVEALACEIPVAAFDVGDAARILGARYVTAPVGDVHGLAEAVLRALSAAKSKNAESPPDFDYTPTRMAAATIRASRISRRQNL